MCVYQKTIYDLTAAASSLAAGMLATVTSLVDVKDTVSGYGIDSEFW